MGRKRLLFINSEMLSVFVLQGGAVRWELECSNDEDGAALLTALISRQPDLPNIILVDLVEEEFKVELTPYLFTGRAQFLARTSERLFRLTPWRHWQILGRATTGRRDSRVLFTAITNNEPLTSWLAVLNRLKAPLTAIRSVPHLTSQLLKLMGIISPAALLITEQRGSGLRQTFFRDGQLIISRLAPLRHDETAVEYAGIVHDEIIKTMRYLQRLQLLAFNVPVDVYLLNSPGCLDAVTALGKIGDNLRLHFLPLSEVAEKLHCPWEAEEYQADYLLAVLALTTRGNDYASLNDRSYAIHQYLRRGINAVALLALTGSMAIAANYAADIHMIRQQSDTMAGEIARYQKLAFAQSSVSETLPSESEANFKRDTVRAARQLTSLAVLPNPLLTELGRLLARYPAFRGTTVSWQKGTARQLALAALADQETPEGAAAEFYQVVTITGVVSLEQLTIRQATEQFRHLTGEAARQISDFVTLEVVEAPLDLRPTGAINRRAEATLVSAPFSFRLICKIAAPVEESP